VTLAVRAEDVQLHPLGHPPRASLPHAVGKIEFVRDLGPLAELIVRCGAERLRCRSATASMREARVGEQVSVHFDAQRCSVFPAALAA
jgi:putative spermidine/putrescine transport system ATP-binding protein